MMFMYFICFVLARPGCDVPTQTIILTPNSQADSLQPLCFER